VLHRERPATSGAGQRSTGSTRTSSWVAAAGNHGDFGEDPNSPERRQPAWPAALDDVIAVGGANRDGSRPAPTPKNAPWIDVYARGVNVVSTYLTQQ
jgi:membrane-anchored mycosin MYCP